MSATETQNTLKCDECGISQTEHQGLYGTALGVLTFTFQPDHGDTIHGQIHLCRPCTHDVLSRRILESARVPPEMMSPDIWT